MRPCAFTLLMVALILKTEALEELTLSCTEGQRITRIGIDRQGANNAGGLELTVHCDRCEQSGVFEGLKNIGNTFWENVGKYPIVFA